jgi:hypothetical protein
VLAADGAILGQVDLVGSEAVVAALALHQGVGEALQVPGGLPHPSRGEDPGVEADDVVPGPDVVPPPGLLDVVAQLDAEGAVVPHPVEAAVDLAAGEDEAAPLAERHQLLHGHFGLGHQR